MLMLGRDHSMYYEAYNDLTDLDEDGSIDGVFTPHVIYDGIFESNWCYSYTDNMFKMSKLADSKESYNGNPVYKCNGLWSGNFLNYITSSRMDIVKRILIGGQRFTNLSFCKTKSPNALYGTCRDEKNYPILARQFIPHDTHGWAKSYHKDDIDERCKKFGYGCSLKYWAPIDADSAMFGSVGRELLVAKAGDIYNGTNMNMGSYQCLSNNSCSDTNAVFVWNWVARESGAFGATNSGAKGPLSISGNTTAMTTAMNRPGVTANGGHFSVTASKYNVIVQACNFAADPMASMPLRCKNYGTDKNKLYNTVGLLQDFSKQGEVDAYFGLITAVWSGKESLKDQDAVKRAALRAPIADLSLSTQMNPTNGDFVENSVYALIDILSLSSNERSGSSTSASGTSGTWTDCTIVSSNDQTTPQRGCSDWGNPLAPMIQKSFEYFSDTSVTESGSDFLAVRRFLNDDVSKTRITYQYPRLSTGSGTNRTPFGINGTFDYCYRPINFILTDENVSMDYISSGPNSAGIDDSHLADGFKYISEKEGGSFIGDHIFGELTDAKSMSTGQTIHTIKNVASTDDLMNVRGVSTLEPNLQGSLKGAALAAYLHTHPLEFDFKTDEGTVRKTVPGFQHFAVAMASYLPQFEVYAKNGKKVLIVPTCKAPRKLFNSSIKDLGSFTYDTENLQKGSAYTSNCAVADVFYVNSSHSKVKGGTDRLTSLEFRVTYEDNEAGSDFDMDALFTYKLWADETDENLINVSITGFYHDTYAGQIGGYSIFGTKGVITPNYEKCTSKKCSTGDTQYIVDGRNFYLDMMKVDQNANNYTLMRSFSDPYNEYNNVDGLDAGTSVSYSSELKPVTVSSQGARSTDNNHRYNCIKDDQINNYIRGWVYNAGANKSDLGNMNYIKFLPSFSSSCISTVTRQFYVSGFDENTGFYDSPLAYTAYYGSKYGDGEQANREQRLKHNPNYFYVTNASKLAAQITAALSNAVGSGGHSGTGLTFPSLDVSADGVVVTATFDNKFWNGALHKNKLTINSDGTVSVTSITGSPWEHDEVSFTNRKVLIADKAGNLTPIDENFDLLAQASKYPLADAVVEQMGMAECDVAERKELISRYLEYVIKGDGSNEYEGNEAEMDNSLLEPKMTCGSSSFYGFHARSESTPGTPHETKIRLGAIIGSTPQSFTVGGVKKIIVAANDGMVHIVNDADGEVEYSIIPYVSQQYMPKYAKAGNVDHLINDGVLSVKTFNIKSSVTGAVNKRIIAVGTLGVVHPGVYAIDLTKAPYKMLWELSDTYEKDKDSDRVRNVHNLGAIKSKVSVVPYNDGDKQYIYAVFGNGYNSADGVAGIIVVNALTGKVHTDIAGNTRFKGGVLVNSYGWSNPACTRDEHEHPNAYMEYKDAAGNCYKNGMNELLLDDRTSDGTLDYIYATDLYGNVYRVKVESPSSASGLPVKDWILSHIHTTVSPYNTATAEDLKVQPITTAPSLGVDANGKPMVIVGTGKYLGASDVKNGDIQSIWALSDTAFATATDSKTILCNNPDDLSCYRPAGVGTSLYRVKAVVASGGSGLSKGYREFEAEGSYDVDQHAGWVLDFDTVGASGISERVKSNMMVLDRHLLVLTSTPSGSDCDGGGTGNWYDISITNADFYRKASDSQDFSEHMYTELSLVYVKANASAAGTEGGEGGEGGHGGEGGEGGEGERLGSGPRCLNAMSCAGNNEGNLADCRTTLKICPRIESWQHIYN